MADTRIVSEVKGYKVQLVLIKNENITVKAIP